MPSSGVCLKTATVYSYAYNKCIFYFIGLGILPARMFVCTLYACLVPVEVRRMLDLLDIESWMVVNYYMGARN